jgi:hypothetical protein
MLGYSRKIWEKSAYLGQCESCISFDRHPPIGMRITLAYALQKWDIFGRIVLAMNMDLPVTCTTLGN